MKTPNRTIRIRPAFKVAVMIVTILGLVTFTVLTLLGEPAVIPTPPPPEVEAKATPEESQPPLAKTCKKVKTLLRDQTKQGPEIGSGSLRNLLLDTPGPGYKQNSEVDLNDADKAASYRPDNELWYPAFVQTGFESGWARNWAPPSGKPMVGTTVWDFLSPEGAQAIQSFAGRYACQSANEVFQVTGIDGAMGLDLGTTQQVSFVRGDKRFLIVAAYEKPQKNHRFVADLAKRALRKASGSSGAEGDPACTTARRLAGEIDRHSKIEPLPNLATKPRELERYLAPPPEGYVSDEPYYESWGKDRNLQTSPGFLLYGHAQGPGPDRSDLEIHQFLEQYDKAADATFELANLLRTNCGEYTTIMPAAGIPGGRSRGCVCSRAYLHVGLHINRCPRPKCSSSRRDDRSTKRRSTKSVEGLASLNRPPSRADG
jgi:hypothetical protein